MTIQGISGIPDWSSGDGPPTGVGDPHDLYLDRTTGKVYEYIAGLPSGGSGAYDPVPGSRLIADTRRLLQGSIGDEINVLGGAFAGIPDGQVTGTLVLRYDPKGGKLIPGTTLTVGLNVLQVLEYTQASKTATVVAHPSGTKNGPAADGSLVSINPRHSDYAIWYALNDAIRAMSSPAYSLFGVQDWSFNSDGTTEGYVLPPEVTFAFLRPIAFRYVDLDRLGDWVTVPGWFVKTFGAKMVLQGAIPPPGGTVCSLTFARRFSPMVDETTDLVLGCGLDRAMLDIPPLGAAASLLLGREAGRNQIKSQSDPRIAAEVQSGANLGTARERRRDFERRCGEEYARLLNLFPLQRTFP